MKATSRSWAVIAGLTLSLAGLVGLAAPASAAYSSTPVRLAWTPDGPVHAVAVSSDRIYVGGTFTGTGGIAALDAATGALLWSASTDGDVRALAVSADGSRLLAGGSFLTVNGTTHKRLVALSAVDGSVVTTWTARATAIVRDLVVDGDTLYIGGKFGSLNGVSQHGLGAVVVSTGQRDATFQAFTDKTVYGLAKAGSTLVVSGSFTVANGIARHSLASFDLSDGALTTWAPARICPTCNNYWDIAVDERNVYVGSSGPGGQLAAFDLVTGQQPWPYVHTDGDVQALAVADDGLVYIGGHFAQYVANTSNPRKLLAAVNRTTGLVDPEFAPRLHTSYPGVWAMAASPTTLFAGGDFSGVDVGGVNNHVPYLAAFAR